MQSYLTQTFDLNSPEIVTALDELCLWSSYPGAMILAMAAFRKNAAILDVGFGTGFPIIELAQRFGDGAKVYGIDPWVAATARAREKTVIMGLTNISYINGKAESIPFPDDTFDLIVSNNGLNNTEDELLAMQECERVLKPGGQFIFAVNLPGTMKEFYRIFTKVLKSKGLTHEISALKHHISEKRKSVAELNVLINNSNLTIKKVKRSTFLLRYLNGAAFFNHHFIKLCFLDSWVKIVPEEMLGEIFAETETELNAYAEKQGGLNLSVPLICYDCLK